MTEVPYRIWKIPAQEWMECCSRCGALIGDRALHDEWHAQADSAVRDRETT